MSEINPHPEDEVQDVDADWLDWIDDAYERDDPKAERLREWFEERFT